MEHGTQHSNTTHSFAPLPAGALVGDYRLVRCLSSAEGSNTYLAFAPDGSAYQLIEEPPATPHPLYALAALRLDHPALHAPHATFELDERRYSILPDLPGAQPFTALSPGEALRHIIAVGEALAYLHSRNIAHLHVHPDSLIRVEGQMRLSGLEHAQVLHQDDANAPFLFARDANFLARTLGTLAAERPGPANDQALAEAINQIQERGASQSYQTVAQVLADCQRALAQMEPAHSPPPDQTPARAVVISAGYATSVGLVRPNNEDALGEWQVTARDGHRPPLQIACFVVADGVGGEARGELASHLATRTILAHIIRHLALPLLSSPDAQNTGEWLENSNLSFWRQETDHLAPERLTSAESATRIEQMRAALLDGFRAANRQIRALARAHGQTIGATATALLIVGDQALIAHVGDSRAYTWLAGTLTTLTQDHSYVQRLIQLGQLDPADRAGHPQRHALYRSLGLQDHLEVDLVSCPLADGERLLLCTDGLWDTLSYETLTDLLAPREPALPPETLAKQLVALADQAGGEDNSTAIVIEIHQAE